MVDILEVVPPEDMRALARRSTFTRLDARDAVLIDPDEHAERLLLLLEGRAQAFEEVGARPPRSRIHHEVGKGSDKLIPEFVEDDQKAERASELHSEYYAELQEHGHSLPGAKKLIASLVDQGYEVWLATSAKPEELAHHMSELEAEGKISGVSRRPRRPG